MREIRPSGSEGGEAETNRPSLPLSIIASLRDEIQSGAGLSPYNDSTLLDQVVELGVAELVHGVAVAAVAAFDQHVLDRRVLAVVHVRRGPPDFHQRWRDEAVRGGVELAPAAHVVAALVGVERLAVAVGTTDLGIGEQLLCRARPTD